MGRACACLCLCSGVCAPRYTGYTRYTMYKVHGVSLRNWRETGSSRGGGGNADFYLMGKQKPQWVLEPARVREGRQCDPPRGRDLYWARFGSASAALNTLIRACALSLPLSLSYLHATRAMSLPKQCEQPPPLLSFMLIYALLKAARGT